MQTKPNLYISCPVSISPITLRAFDKAASMLGANVQYWKQGTKYEEEANVKTCDFFVLILPNLNWRINVSNLPSGCKKELQVARSANRTILLGYRNSTGGYKFYDTDFDSSGLISGIAGTSDKLKAAIQRFQSEQTSKAMSLGYSVPPCEVLYGAKKAGQWVNHGFEIPVSCRATSILEVNDNCILLLM